MRGGALLWLLVLLALLIALYFTLPKKEPLPKTVCVLAKFATLPLPTNTSLILLNGSEAEAVERLPNCCIIVAASDEVGKYASKALRLAIAAQVQRGAALIFWQEALTQVRADPTVIGWEGLQEVVPARLTGASIEAVQENGTAIKEIFATLFHEIESPAWKEVERKTQNWRLVEVDALPEAHVIAALRSPALAYPLPAILQHKRLRSHYLASEPNGLLDKLLAHELSLC